MTREEAISILAGMYRIPVENGADKFASEINKAIDMAIEALQDDWIPVSVRLPKGYDQYLCYCEDGYCDLFWLDNEPWAEKTVEKEGIIAWRPLPEPYKGSEGEEE
jgi:hypothetical protein